MYKKLYCNPPSHLSGPTTQLGTPVEGASGDRKRDQGATCAASQDEGATRNREWEDYTRDQSSRLLISDTPNSGPVAKRVKTVQTVQQQLSAYTIPLVSAKLDRTPSPIGGGARTSSAPPACENIQSSSRSGLQEQDNHEKALEWLAMSSEEKRESDKFITKIETLEAKKKVTESTIPPQVLSKLLALWTAANPDAVRPNAQLDMVGQMDKGGTTNTRNAGSSKSSVIRSQLEYQQLYPPPQHAKAQGTTHQSSDFGSNKSSGSGRGGGQNGGDNPKRGGYKGKNWKPPGERGERGRGSSRGGNRGGSSATS